MCPLHAIVPVPPTPSMISFPFPASSCSAADVSGASGEISGDDDDGDDIIALPLPENSPDPASAAILSPTSPMEPRQAVFPAALAMSLSPADPSASPAPVSQWLDIPDATQPVYTTTVFDVGCVIGVRVWLEWAPSATCTALSDRAVYHPPTVTLLDVQVLLHLQFRRVAFWFAQMLRRALRGLGSG
jgi:hypothetical protein